ncbi:hypothetical protein AB204_01030 [Xenorhabdus khoisanae]|uniref:Uncharacterized protein n=1 Tax=Xenorhabdus khoisanae TaxID=880157 RepID=A0A0J5FXH8_9GAMM|nr:hypothetical protein [Xenorhabdus khoisanae]KMJ46906.1 hypothetical protein AB204_01030 [Xenorhabdus khoisanae]
MILTTYFNELHDRKNVIEEYMNPRTGKRSLRITTADTKILRPIVTRNVQVDVVTLLGHMGFIWDPPNDGYALCNHNVHITINIYKSQILPQLNQSVISNMGIHNFDSFHNVVDSIFGNQSTARHSPIPQSPNTLQLIPERRPSPIPSSSMATSKTADRSSVIRDMESMFQEFGNLSTNELPSISTKRNHQGSRTPSPETNPFMQGKRARRDS